VRSDDNAQFVKSVEVLSTEAAVAVVDTKEEQ
jgi:hypothetical protein